MTVTGSDVSVVIPTWANAPRLRQGLEAIARQSCLPGEVVVADDGSVDETAAVVARFAREHPELPTVYVPWPVNTGVVGNRNRGIAAASGTWIANCDDDDVWLPQKLERQLALINGWTGAKPLALVGCWGTNVNDRLEPMSAAQMGTTTEAEYERMMADAKVFFLIHSSVVFRKSDYDAAGGYDDEYGQADEFSFYCRLADVGVVLNLPEPLLLYRKRPGSLQLMSFASQNEGLARLEVNRLRQRDGLPPLDVRQYEAMLAAAPLRSRLRRRLQMAGMFHYRKGAMELANGRRMRGGLRMAMAAVLDPRRVRDGLRLARLHRRGQSASST